MLAAFLNGKGLSLVCQGQVWRREPMDKGQLHFIIDAVMFLVIAAAVGLGLLREDVMPSGRRL
jgi:hypothetical protein